MATQHLLVLRDGQSLSGLAQPKTYAVEHELGNFKVPATSIVHIHFQNGTPQPTDEILIRNGTNLRGDVLPDPIPFKITETGQVMKVPQSKIHTLIFISNIFEN